MVGGQGRVAFVAAGVLVALLLGTGMETAISPPPPHTVYTVAEVQAGLARRPAVWVGRTVWLRGIALSSYCVFWPSAADAPCPGWRPVLIDPCVMTGPCGVNVLPAAVGAPHPLLRLLGRLPLVGRLLPAPHRMSWGVVRTYHAQLRAASVDLCLSPPCYEALVLDAAP